MEKEVIVQIYRRIYSIEKENNFESVYKYQDIITGIEVTLENGNKVFKDNNNNIFQRKLLTFNFIWFNIIVFKENQSLFFLEHFQRKSKKVTKCKLKLNFHQN